MHWVPHLTACILGTYVVCSSKGIQWHWGMYIPRDEIKWLVVEWTGTLVEFHQSYNDFNHFNSCSGRLELWLCPYSAFQTRHISQTIRVARRNGQYMWVLETSIRQLDQLIWIMQASLLPFCPLLVLETGRGIPPAVQVWTGNMVQFGSGTYLEPTSHFLAVESRPRTRQPAGFVRFG